MSPSKGDDRRAAIVAQQAAREKAEREARGESPNDKAGAGKSAIGKKGRFNFRRGPGRPPRPREE